MLDEGYIKFKAHWRERPPLPEAEIAELNHWRDQMYRAQLIGAYPDGIGFGNIWRRYAACPEGRAVIHVPHLALWETHLHRSPTTWAAAAYGTPEMALEIIRLLHESTVRREEQVLVMAGHREGLIAFGEDLAGAGERLLALC